MDQKKDSISVLIFGKIDLQISILDRELINPISIPKEISTKSCCLVYIFKKITRAKTTKKIIKELFLK